jgi:hypothetical protein
VERFFEGLGAFADYLEERASLEEEMLETLAGAASVELYKKAYDMYGDVDKLAPLAESTQEERERLGFTPNDPLLRDGTRLRKNLERFHEGNISGIGSADPVQLYHEEGYTTQPFGNKNAAPVAVPPRPIMKQSLNEAKPEIDKLLEEGAGALFGFTPLAIE